MFRKTYRPPRVLPFFVLLLVIALGVIRLQSQNGPFSSPPDQATEGTAPDSKRAFDLPPRWVKVQRAVDGDTLLLEGGERVRLFGVNTPETTRRDEPPEPFGPEATLFTASLVNGQLVRLEFDIERYDKYGRTLAYVYAGDVFLNEALILEGLSAAHLQYSFRSDMKRRFAAAERVARAKKVGLWSIFETETMP